MSGNARDLVNALIKARACIATVESCTGGLVARQITEIDGCSAAYWGGWVTYDNSAKTSSVGVPPALIEKHGAISPEVARAMAEGGLRRMMEARKAENTRYACVSTTGIAGPGGGTPAKEVGLCYVGVAAPGQETQVVELKTTPDHDRAANQSAFTEAAFVALQKMVQRLP